MLLIRDFKYLMYYIYKHKLVILIFSEFSENETGFTNIAQESFIKAIIMCLQKIQPTINLSFTIPRSMSARYQYGITVADACKVILGFL